MKNVYMGEIYLYEKLLQEEIRSKNVDKLEETLYIIRNIEKPCLGEKKLRSLKNYYIRLCCILEFSYIHEGYEVCFLQNVTKESVRDIELCESVDEVEQTFAQIVENYLSVLREKGKGEFLRPIDRAKEYIHKRLHENLTLEAVAEELGITPIYLSTLFKKELKINFIDYINQLKINHSLNYLSYTDLPISTIATQVGFCNQSYYSAIFKKVMGQTPFQFRKRIRQ